jgi:hypothetical protein
LLYFGLVARGVEAQEVLLVQEFALLSIDAVLQLEEQLLAVV